MDTRYIKLNLAAFPFVFDLFVLFSINITLDLPLIPTNMALR